MLSWYKLTNLLLVFGPIDMVKSGARNFYRFLVQDAQTSTHIQRQQLREKESAYQRRSDNAEKTMR